MLNADFSFLFLFLSLKFVLWAWWWKFAGTSKIRFHLTRSTMHELLHFQDYRSSEILPKHLVAICQYFITLSFIQKRSSKALNVHSLKSWNYFSNTETFKLLYKDFFKEMLDLKYCVCMIKEMLVTLEKFL